MGLAQRVSSKSANHRPAQRLHVLTHGMRASAVGIGYQHTMQFRRSMLEWGVTVGRLGAGPCFRWPIPSFQSNFFFGRATPKPSCRRRVASCFPLAPSRCAGGFCTASRGFEAGGAWVCAEGRGSFPRSPSAPAMPAGEWAASVPGFGDGGSFVAIATSREEHAVQTRRRRSFSISLTIRAS
jgi:hypothetical protein